MAATRQISPSSLLTTREICACLPTIGLLIGCWAAGQWLKTTVRAQRRCTWSMHRPEPSPRIVRRTLSRRHRSREGSVQTTTKDMTTGTVSRAGTLAGWFVMLKDNVGRFSGNKLWGDGWGWSWFDATKALFHLRFRKLHMAPGMRCRTGFP